MLSNHFVYFWKITISDDVEWEILHRIDSNGSEKCKNHSPKQPEAQ